MSPTSSRPPSGVPGAGGNAKYALGAVIFLVGIIGIFVWRSCPPPPAPPAAPPVASSVAQPEPSNPKLDDIPPPPPIEEKPETGPVGPRVIYVQAGGCDGKCAGVATPELAEALKARGAQARRCYNAALARDSSLRGRISLAIRVGTAGNVCSVNVSANDMGTPAVANCAANIFGGAGSYPAPRGGCVDATVPLNFVPQGQ